MFQAAVGQFVKDMCGDGSLLPAPSLDAAEMCRPMHVVIKKNRRWCWQKPVYSPQPFTLQDLMVNPTEPLKVDVTPRSYVTYNQTSKFAVNGDVGTSLKQVVDLKLSASDTINVEALFGEVVKYDVDETSLLRSVDERILNFNHSLLQEVRQNPRKVLCIVVGTAMNKEDSNLHMHATIGGKEVCNLTKSMQIVAKGNISSGISDDRDTSFIIPENTPLAYNMYELLVSPGGHISVILQKDCHGGFLDFDSMDAAGRKLDSTYGLAKNLDRVHDHISTSD